MSSTKRLNYGRECCCSVCLCLENGDNWLLCDRFFAGTGSTLTISCYNICNGATELIGQEINGFYVSPGVQFVDALTTKFQHIFFKYVGHSIQINTLMGDF